MAKDTADIEDAIEEDLTPAAKRGFFSSLASRTAHFTGHPAVFLTAVLVVAAWLVSGPFFGYSDTWQLVINTGTTIITFLMVFLIQNTQNRDTHAIQLKLDELIRTTEGAHNVFLDLEELEEAELMDLHRKYYTLAQKAREQMRTAGGVDTGVPDFPKN